ncbi:MAG TPA: nicotinate-nucleotide adenylyltransferase [Anaerolineae bacterium]|nr:nicotinate-nucleotide adenylyltransferase [Anaerolineae bacterium]
MTRPGELGVLGGTFDPIHHGHLVAAQEAWWQLKLDRVLFVPAGIPPHKRGRRITSAVHRLRMVEMAIAGKPHFAVSRVDLDRGGPSFTLDTLQLLREEVGPDERLYFIEGADSLAEILLWHKPQAILELCDLAVVRRPGVTIDLAGLDAKLPGLAARVHWVEMPWLDISSSNVRARVEQGRPISYLVPECVEAYVLEHALYR